MWADAGFSFGPGLAFTDAWLAAIAFTLEIYYDFSGYTDIAMGSARMLGISLPANFANPYMAKNIIDFWKRWHITLSQFITTYLYTPLVRGTRRVTFWKAMMATLVAMTVAGLWHGAAWTYIVFGLAHGVALVCNHYCKKQRFKIPSFISWAITFGFVVCAFVVFRASSLTHATHILSSMFGAGPLSSYAPYSALGMAAAAMSGLWALVALILVCLPSLEVKLHDDSLPAYGSLALVTVIATLAVMHVNSGSHGGFLYRDF
jgi:D-alanyl-lipoteichoic acid acyltransferase DltB (MBOAT superfamily)